MSWSKSANETCVRGALLIGTFSITKVAGVKVKATISPELKGTKTSENPSASQSVNCIEFVKHHSDRQFVFLQDALNQKHLQYYKKAEL